ncbi:MAG: CsiV family protein [Pseudomonadota bacterium]
MTQNLLSLTLSALALLMCIGPANAQQWYAVEVIIFSESGGGDGESNVGLGEGSPSVGRAVGLGPPASSYDSPRPFQRIARDELQLTAELAELQGSRRYRPLLHVGWYQPGFNRKGAKPVRLRSRGQVVDGVVSLARERYLHLSVDLSYAGFQAGGVPGGARSRLKQRRRMRSRELHYLDHPRFGMLVQATPFDGGTNNASGVPPAVPGTERKPSE